MKKTRKKIFTPWVVIKGVVIRIIITIFLLTNGALAFGADKARKPHFIEQMVPFVFIFLLFYLLLIRPAQKRQKNHQQLISSLKAGDKVITTSGILGTIYSLTDEFIVLEVAENVKIKIIRSQVSAIRPDELKK